MRGRVAAGLTVLGLAATMVFGQSSGRGTVMEPIRKAPGYTRSWTNPYEGQGEAIAAGRKLFQQHCSECHGDDGRGIGKAADLRSDGVQNATAGELVWFLRNGNLAKGMPSWAGLPVQRRWQIVAYLKSLRPTASDIQKPESRLQTTTRESQ